LETRARGSGIKREKWGGREWRRKRRKMKERRRTTTTRRLNPLRK